VRKVRIKTAAHGVSDLGNKQPLDLRKESREGWLTKTKSLLYGNAVDFQQQEREMKVQFNEVRAYINAFPGLNVERELSAVASGERVPLLTNSDYFDKDGNYLLIGKATVTLELVKPEDLHGKQVEALRHKLQTMRAEHQKAQNALIDQISKLEALTYEGGAA
jgi:hypothetical protein